MAKPNRASLASIFDEPENAPEIPATAGEPAARAADRAGEGASTPTAPATLSARRSRAAARPAPSGRKDSHPNKKPVLIHIPEDMHRVLRQLSVEDGGEPITKVVEQGLRDYLVRRGYAKFGAAGG